MKKLAIFIVLALLLTLCSTPVYANGVPALPHAFYGTVKISGSPAPVGTRVEAIGPGVASGIAGNPIYTTVSGIYGTSNPFEPRLIVQGDIDDGETITFYVDGRSTGQTAEWHSGETTELPLSVTITAPAPPRRDYIETNLFGIEASFRISSTGEILETIEATSEDGMLTMTIPEGTIALDKDGNPLSTLTVAVDPDPCACEDAIIGLVYDFGPDGATFDPPITLTWSYDPEALPEGAAEEDLVIAYCDAEAGEWVTCDCTCDPEANCITACVCHFTTFAIIAVPVELPPVVVPPVPAAFSVSSISVLPAEVEPGETVTIAVLVANTGGESGSYTVVLKIDGVKEAEKSITIAAGESGDVSFSVAKEDAGSYTVTVDGLSDSFTVVPVVVPPAPAAFSVSYLSVSPRLEVEPGEAVTITVFVANTGGESGSYTVVLKIDGVKEAEKSVTVAPGESQDVSFSVTKEEAGSHTVTVDGLSGSFTVVVPPAKPGINWPLIGGIIGGVVVVGLLVFLFVRRRAY